MIHWILCGLPVTLVSPRFYPALIRCQLRGLTSRAPEIGKKKLFVCLFVCLFYECYTREIENKIIEEQNNKWSFGVSGSFGEYFLVHLEVVGLEFFQFSARRLKVIF